MQPVDPLSPVIIFIMYFGDVVFAVSGALTAARHRMDVLGVVLIGVITGIGGGTLRDMLLGNPVWWIQSPNELLLCAGVALAAYFCRHIDIGKYDAVIWADALGLAAFAVTGAHVALNDDVPIVIAAFLGMITATGGGVIRDLLTQTRPMILTGEIYATAALAGAVAYALLSRYLVSDEAASFIAFAIALGIRGAAIVLGVRYGVGSDPLIVGRQQEK